MCWAVLYCIGLCGVSGVGCELCCDAKSCVELFLTVWSCVVLSTDLFYVV